MRQGKPKDEKSTKSDSESESEEESSSDEEVPDAVEENEASDGDGEDGDATENGSDAEDSDGDSSSTEHSDQMDTNRTDQTEQTNQEETDSDSNSGSDSEDSDRDSDSSKLDNIQQEDMRSVSNRSMDAGALDVEGSALVESRPPSVASSANHPDIVVREATGDLGPNKTLPSNPTGAHYRREARSSASTMSDEPDLDLIAQRRGTRRGSLFDIPQGPRRPTMTGASMTSSSLPHEEDTSTGQYKPPKKFENNYRLEPVSKFRSSKARVIIEELLEQQLENQTYDPVACGMLSMDLSAQIKDKVKNLGYDRYKYVAVVTIGDKKEQGIRIGSRAIWDVERDTSASVTYENSSIFAVANFFALYFE